MKTYDHWLIWSGEELWPSFMGWGAEEAQCGYIWLSDNMLEDGP